MSAFQHAFVEFLRLQALEQGITGEDALAEACDRTDDAFEAMIDSPAENIAQAAAKLAALASQYNVPSCGVSPTGWAMLVAEVCRFSVGETMSAAA